MLGKISLEKVFTSIFDEPLLKCGFKRNGVLYYRLNGNILQGIILVKTSPYIVRYNAIPYWACDSDNKVGANCATYLKEGGWAEGNIEDFNGVHFDPRAPEKTIKNLNETLAIIENFVIPRLDIVNDEFSYYAYISNVGKWENIPQKVVLHISSLQNSFALAYTHLRFLRLQAKMGCYALAISSTMAPYFAALKQNREMNASGFAPTFPIMPDPDKNQNIIRSYQYAKNASFALLEEKIQSNDLHWIDQVYEEECLRIGELLKVALDIDVG